MADAINDAKFQEQVLQSDIPVLVDFWAPWCGPCRALGPVIDEISEEFKGKAKIFKMNVDENSGTAAQYAVSSIPTVLIFRNGEIAEQFVGVQPKQTYVDALS